MRVWVRLAATAAPLGSLGNAVRTAVRLPDWVRSAQRADGKPERTGTGFEGALGSFGNAARIGFVLQQRANVCADASARSQRPTRFSGLRRVRYFSTTEAQSRLVWGW